MNMIEHMSRERCQCGAEYEVGSRYGGSGPPAELTEWRIGHGRGCDLMYACLNDWGRAEARPPEEDADDNGE